MTETSPTRVVRRTLEEALSTAVASTVLFEALGAAPGGVPHTREALLAVVRGPLAEALARQLEPAAAEALVTRIAEQLAPLVADSNTVELPLEELAAEGRREQATMAFPTADRAVRVLVIAASPGFARKLLLALGERRVAPSTSSSARSLAEAVGGPPPALMVVDASDFPALDRDAVLRAARALPKTTACVLYGSDLPYGKSFAEAIAAQDRGWVTLELREGVAPLLDLIRSRRASAP